jgi:lysophospholipase L1-like esterase
MMKKSVIPLLLLSCAFLIGSAQAAAKKKINHGTHYTQRMTYFDSLPPITDKDYVMLGNSLTEFGENWNKWLTGEEIGHFVNRGIIGDTAMGMYERLYQILPYHPSRLYLMSGINDISHNLTAKSVIRLVTKLVDKIRKDSPTTKLYLQSLLPINEGFHRWTTLEGKTEVIVEVNEGLRKLAKSRDITYIDLFPLFTKEGTHIMREELSIDGLHLKAEGYVIWSKALQPYI